MDSTPQTRSGESIGSLRGGRGRGAHLALVITVAATILVGTVTPATSAPSAPTAPVQSAPSSLGPYGDIAVLWDGSQKFSVGGLQAAGVSTGIQRQVFAEWDAVMTAAEQQITALAAPQIDLALRTAELGDFAASIGFKEANLKLKAIDVDIVDGSPLAMKFTGNGSGTITADVTLPKTSVWIKAKRADWGVSVRWTTYVGPIKASIDYNLADGHVGNVTVTDLPVSTCCYRADTGIGYILSGGLLNWLATTVAASLIDKEIKNYVTEWVDENILGFEDDTFGLDSVLARIPANLTVDGKNVRQWITDVMNKNLKGTLLSFSVNSGSASLPMPWGWQGVSGVRTMHAKVGRLELRVRYAANVPHPCAENGQYDYAALTYCAVQVSSLLQQAQQMNSSQVTVLMYNCASGSSSACTSLSQLAQQYGQQALTQLAQQLCSSGYLPSAWCSQYLGSGSPTTTTTRPTTTTTRPTTTTTRPTTTTTTQQSSSAAHIQTRAQAHLQQLTQQAQELQQYLAALQMRAQAQPHLASSIAAAAYSIQQQLQALAQQAAVAQSCISNPSTSQCQQLYG